MHKVMETTSWAPGKLGVAQCAQNSGLRGLGEGMSVEGWWGPGHKGTYSVGMDEAFPRQGNIPCSLLKALDDTDKYKEDQYHLSFEDNHC